jgi:hypothetical protein
MRRSAKVAIGLVLGVVLVGLVLVKGLSRLAAGREEREAPEAALLAAADYAKSGVRDGAVAPPPPAGAAGGSAVRTVALRQISRKLVRTVELGLEVKATSEAAEELRQVAARLGGYVGNVNAWRVDGLMRYTMTLRVPTERLDEALAAAKKLAWRIDREQQTVEDVTDQYIDLDARMKTLRGTEDELLALLAESRRRKSEVDDIMKVYERLTEIRSQIEEIQGKLVALEKLAALSTLNVTLTPTEGSRPVAPPGWHPGDIVRSDARSLVGILQGLGNLAIWLVVVALPVIALLLIFVLPASWLVRRLRRRRSAVAAP